MAEQALDVLSAIMLLTGGVFGVLGGIGVVRFPDFFSRLHAAGMTDTLCAFLIIGGLVIQAGVSLLSIKLVLILLFMIFTTPTASHALARAGLAAGFAPRTADNTAPKADPGGPPSNT
jgi:multicomponent Na+:H+ antiporter subunit G